MRAERIAPLLITPAPRKLESLQGYLLRVCDANGYHSPEWLLRQFGIRHRFRLESNELERLALGLRQPVEDLEALQYGAVPDRARWLRFNGQEVHRCSILHRHKRFCPTCLAEDGYFHAVWDLKPVTACPRHGVYLQESCNACYKALKWSRERLFHCDCGNDLRHQRPWEAPPNTVALCARIQELSGDTDASQPAGALLPGEFLALDLSTLLNHVLFLSTYASGRGRGTGRRLHGNLASAASKATFDRASNIIANWPHAFFGLLDDIRRHAGEKQHRTGLEAEFRMFYSNLYGRSHEATNLMLIRDAFQAYLTRYWSGGVITTKNTKLSGSLSEERGYVSLSDGARRLGVHPAVLRRAIEAGDLGATCRPMKGRMLRLIEADELERYRNSKAELLTAQDLKKRLGLSKKPVMQLVRDGVIKAAKGPSVDGRTHWAFREQDVETLLHALTGKLPRRRNADSFVPFEKAIRRATAKGISVSDIVVGMLSGELRGRCLASSEPSLRGVCFDERELLSFLYDGKRIIQWAMPIEKAARYLRLNEEATRDLVRNGLLTTIQVHADKREKRQISRDSLERFRASYVSASELAVRKQTSPRALVAQMESEGIFPATGPRVDGGRQYFFRRPELEARR